MPIAETISQRYDEPSLKREVTEIIGEKQIRIRRFQFELAAEYDFHLVRVHIFNLLDGEQLLCRRVALPVNRAMQFVQHQLRRDIIAFLHAHKPLPVPRMIRSIVGEAGFDTEVRLIEALNAEIVVQRKYM